uniref:Uncharacterized protein n=1 Tax=Acrobeloides nanus TaxID=290746 RepID=A0A914DIT7_9BILA
MMTTTSSLRKNPLEILSTLRKKTPADEPDWILRFDNFEQKKREKKCGGIKAESLSKPPCIVLVLGGDRRVQHVEFRERLDGIDEKDFLSKCIFELCPRSDRPVLETLLDSVTQCSAELKICVNNKNLNINATSARQSGSEQIRLECKLVERTSHHSVEQQSNLSVYPFEAISPASSTSRDVPHDMMGSPTMCTSVLSDSFETKPSNLTENKFRQQPLTIPHQEQPSYNFSYFTKPDSSSFDFGDKEESPSAKKKRRPSKVKIKPMNEENNGISKNTSLFSPTTIETPKPKNTMLQTLLTSNAPCISFNINQIPNMSSPQYFSNPVSRQAYMVENQVGATKQKATKTSRAKRKELANSTAAATTPTSTSTTAIGFAVGSSIPHQNLPANMFQTSMASVQMGGGMAAYVMTGPGPMPNGAQMNGGVVYNPHNMPIASTSSGG